jgi:hypothetical protein
LVAIPKHYAHWPRGWFNTSFYVGGETAEEFSVKRFVLQLICIVPSIRIRNLVVTLPNEI